MSTYFFTGGTFPSADLLLYFQHQLTIEKTWYVNGEKHNVYYREFIIGNHYSKTCEDWLNLLLKNRKEAMKALETTYRDKAAVWFNRWIVFYLVFYLFIYD